MQRKAVKLFGLVLIGAAAFSALRRLLHRSDDDQSEPPVEPRPLASVPDLEPDPVDARGPEPEPSAEPASESEPEPRSDSGSEPKADESEQRWRQPVDEGCPPGYPIKVNERSGIYHVPDGLSYARTNPTRCYPNEAAAQADGFRRAKR